MSKFLISLLFLFFSSPIIAETRDAEQYFFDLKLGDFKHELTTAKAEGKSGIFMMFEQEGCPYCLKMRSTILNQSEVQNYFHKHFLIFTIDIHGDLPMQDFSGEETTEKVYSAENSVFGTPTFDFYDLDGKRIVRFYGATKDQEELMLLGKCAAEGECKSMTFAEYKKKMRK